MIESVPGGIRLRIHAQPNASKTEVVGPVEGALKIRLRAPPVDGKANDALIEFLAKFFRRPRRDVTLLKGEGSRHKLVQIDGITAAEARAAL